MKDLEKVISGLSKSGLLSGLAGGLAGGSAAGLLANKKSRKKAKKVLKYGALAAVGGVAWKAYKSYSTANSGEQSHAGAEAQVNPPKTRQLSYEPQSLSQQQFESVVEESPQNPGQMLLLRAMITAANADGHIDGGERERIYKQVETMELSVADKAALFDELRKPLSLEQLVAAVPNSESAVEVYAASLIAIDNNQPASTGYLQSLASYLCIPQELVSELHKQTTRAADSHIAV